MERFRRPQAKPSPSPDLIRLTFQTIDESEDDDGGDWDWNCSFGERELRESVCERERVGTCVLNDVQLLFIRCSAPTPPPKEEKKNNTPPKKKKRRKKRVSPGRK